MAAVVRRPAVAGYFYPSDADALRAEVDALSAVNGSRAEVLAAVVPHGSYVRSGAVAGAVFGRIAISRRCLIIGPSHTGTWMPWSVMTEGAYRTPLGDVPIDSASAEALRLRCPFLEADAWAQRGEHSVEVQLPFLQRLGPAQLSVVPVIIGTEDAEELRQFATAVAQVVRMLEEPMLLIASSDLSHYQAQSKAIEQDRQIIQAIQEMDGALLRRRVVENNMAICGLASVWCLLEASRQLGAAGASCAAYQTSAETGGDPDSVIGYGGIIISKSGGQQP